LSDKLKIENWLFFIEDNPPPLVVVVVVVVPQGLFNNQ